ncbi:MAG TPA: extracellular solute-binding protein [Xanthobacteraceae bacterium]|nr:extracellular solute-binding protein [Xanthobacteraceae bacterium]
MSLTRRSLIHAAAVTPMLAALRWPALAQSTPSGNSWRHALSLFGEVKYPPGFQHFDYVNPKAPKGGAVRQAAIGTFDNFNMTVSGVKGTIAMGIELIYDTLMASSLDEVSTEYGLIAESVSHPDDFTWAKFRLRAEAKWHDGKPITPEDVIFSLQAFQKHSPQLAAYYRHVAKAEKTGEREVTFTFDAPGNRELPLILGQLTVLPKHWWEGTDANGRQRDISATTLEWPLGSGVYKVKSAEPGRNVVYERVKDYWGRDLNVNIGRDNFDEMRFEYFRDITVALEAFKGDQLDWRTENSAKNWATAYDFPAVRDNRVRLEEFPIRSMGIMQAFVFNTRREKFHDPRVRRALNFTFDFEEMNKAIFYGQYRRINSYFEGTELAWNWRPEGNVGAAPGAPPAAPSGLPQGQELEILETVRDKVPPEVFTTPYTNPVGGSPTAMRNNLREGLRLFKEAGYEIRDRRMVNTKTGEPFIIEILLSEPTFERVALFLKPTLERLGVGMTVRTVDDSQYENRLRSWDFDVVVGSWAQSLSPGNEQRAYWGSQAADQPGSRNLAGMKNEALDALIQRIIFAKDRAELVAATRAMDRVLLWNHYVIPQWTYGKQRTARWNRFSRPEKLPAYGAAAFPTVWWWDANASTAGARP